METPELKVAEAGPARAGGTVLSRYFREGTAMRSKGVANLVSDADLDAETAVVDVIRSTFPDHEVLAKETFRGDVNAEHLWVVDPLDGTANFAHKIPQFAVSVAYYRHGVAECAVILNPMGATIGTSPRARSRGLFEWRRTHVGNKSKLNEDVHRRGFLL